MLSLLTLVANGKPGCYGNLYSVNLVAMVTCTASTCSGKCRLVYYASHALMSHTVRQSRRRAMSYGRSITKLYTVMMSPNALILLHKYEIYE